MMNQNHLKVVVRWLSALITEHNSWMHFWGGGGLRVLEKAYTKSLILKGFFTLMERMTSLNLLNSGVHPHFSFTWVESHE